MIRFGLHLQGDERGLVDAPGVLQRSLLRIGDGGRLAMIYIRPGAAIETVAQEAWALLVIEGSASAGSAEEGAQSDEVADAPIVAGEGVWWDREERRRCRSERGMMAVLVEGPVSLSDERAE